MGQTAFVLSEVTMMTPTACSLARTDGWMDGWVALRTQIQRDKAGCAKGFMNMHASNIYLALYE